VCVKTTYISSPLAELPIALSDGPKVAQELPDDALEMRPPEWSRRDETVAMLMTLLSHHPPSMYGHCLRLTIRGHSVYLCGRCTGIYGGLGVGLLALLMSQVVLEPSWLWFLIAVALGLTTTIDWMSQRLTPRKTTVRLRFVTGLMTGLGLAIVFYLNNLLFMLVTLAIMAVSVGSVSLVETRRQDEES